MLEQMNQVLINLVNESIACSPSSWRKGTLTIESDGIAVFYKLTNEGSEERSAISDRLRYLCEELYTTMKNNGHIWKKAYIFFYQDLEDGWKYKTEFEYEEPPIKTLKPKRPWWKFW